MPAFLLSGPDLNKQVYLDEISTKISSAVEQRQTEAVYNYTAPDIWNCFDYKGEEHITTPSGEIIVNPHKFYAHLLRKYVLPRATKSIEYASPLSKTLLINQEKINGMEHYEGGDWIKKATLYSSLIRTSTCWDQDRTGKLEDNNIYHLKDTGTFVKSIALLTALKKMGVNTVYMLPISKFSLKNKKGKLGSPYGVCNFFELGPVPTKLCKTTRFQCQFAILLFFTGLIVHATVKMTSDTANEGSFLKHDAYSSQS